MSSVLSFLRLIRWPNLLIIILTQWMARLFLIAPQPDLSLLLTDAKLWLISLTTVCIAAAGYIINDYFDVKIDLINKPDEVVVGRHISRRRAILTHQILTALGIAFSLFISLKVFAIVVMTALLLWFYAASLKRQPLIGNLVVALLTALSLVLLAISYHDNDLLVNVYAIFAFWMTLIREVIKDMEDIRGDARHGCRTLPIVHGIRKTKKILYLMLGLFILTVVAVLWQIATPRLVSIFLLLSLPLGWLAYKLYFADRTSHYAALSRFCKIIMLLGIGTMVVC